MSTGRKTPAPRRGLGSQPFADGVFEVVAVARQVGEARVQVGMIAGGAERPTYKSVLTQIGEKQPR